MSWPTTLSIVNRPIAFGSPVGDMEYVCRWLPEAVWLLDNHGMIKAHIDALSLQLHETQKKRDWWSELCVKSQDSMNALQQTLELIALGEVDNPNKVAEQLLIDYGFWSKDR